MSTPLTTTFQQLRDNHACKEGYAKLRTHLGPRYGDTRPILLTTVLESNGLTDALWVLDHAVAPTDDAKQRRYHLAADYAAHVLPIYERQYPDDPRVRDCIVAVRQYADGRISREQLAVAAYDAHAADAAAAAYDAAIAAYDAHAYAAAIAAYDAYAADAAYAAYAAYAAHYADATDDERAWQTKRFCLVVGSDWTRAMHDEMTP